MNPRQELTEAYTALAASSGNIPAAERLRLIEKAIFWGRLDDTAEALPPPIIKPE